MPMTSKQKRAVRDLNKKRRCMSRQNKMRAKVRKGKKNFKFKLVH